MMKKQSLILGALLVIASGIQAASLKDVMSTVITAFEGFGQNVSTGLVNGTEKFTIRELDLSTPMNAQNESLNEIAQAIAVAKAFAVENSKSVLGAKDADIIKAIDAVEKASMDFINSIKVIRGICSANRSTPQSQKFADALSAQGSQLVAIKSNLTSGVGSLARATIVLPNKKNAKELILTIERLLKNKIDTVYQEVVNREQLARQ
ncbi:MAG TPA: hypothetical protein VKR54_05195 [Candidatus Babeliales bacterium]|jgi:hypothetical protein|nr:hypothetical protein [Candidatus Babeliales bacterium]